MLDYPQSGYALWSLYDRGGPRPEFILPVLFSESGFSPSVVNSIGCSGLNQLCQGIPPGYTSWSASQQLQGVVAPMYLSIVSRYGALRSGTRAYQANFLPATLPYKTKLDDVLAYANSSRDVCPHCGLSQAAVYDANPGLDYRRRGYIAVDDLAHFISRAAGNPTVQRAIAETYALRPGESPYDPVYGEDYAGGIPWGPIALGGLIIGGAATVAYMLGGKRRLF